MGMKYGEICLPLRYLLSGAIVDVNELLRASLELWVFAKRIAD